MVISRPACNLASFINAVCQVYRLAVCQISVCWAVPAVYCPSIDPCVHTFVYARPGKWFLCAMSHIAFRVYHFSARIELELPQWWVNAPPSGQFVLNSGEHIAVSVPLLVDVPNSETSMPPKYLREQAVPTENGPPITVAGALSSAGVLHLAANKCSMP